MYWRGQYARYKTGPDKIPSVMNSYYNALTYVLTAM